MRIKITCDIGEGIRLPINYNYFLASAIYGFLRESDPEYADFLHQDGYELENRRFKLFTFSQLMAKRREIREDQIHFRSPLTWYVLLISGTVFGELRRRADGGRNPTD